MKKVLKILGFIVLGIAILFGIIIAYYNYQEYRKDQKELNYNSNKEWKWHKKHSRIQITYLKEESISVLRKVDLSKNYIIYAFLNDDYRLSTRVDFITDCKPASIITTTKKYSNGDSMKLICNEKGTSLQVNVKWKGEADSVIWNDDFDGFKVDESFMFWDFTKLKKEITLLKAKSVKKKVK